VTLYVAHDERARSLSLWLSDWNPTGTRIDTTDVGRNLFSRDFAAGSITLGGSRAKGVRSNYNVIVVGRGASDPLPNNAAPIVDAGQDQVVTLASPAIAVLDGQVSDDGLPAGQLSFQWSQRSGPGSVSFGDAGAMDTTATFLEAGVYMLSLTANDGDLATSDDVAVTVNQTTQTNQAPVVDAGPNMTINLSAAPSWMAQ
jgi:hypothetical protein